MSSLSPDESNDCQNSSNYQRNGQLDEETETNTSLISNPDIDCRFPIYIESMTATTFKLDVFPVDTVLQIKQQLEYTQGIAICQQRLIWQYEELDNDKAVRDYGIGYGARLRLVIDLMTGPISKSTDDLLAKDMNTDQSRSELCDDDRTVTLVMLRNGDRIKLFSFGSGLSDHKRFNYSNGQNSGENDLPKTINNETLDSKNAKQEEDRLLKNKMNEIQNKLESLRLKRSKSNDKNNWHCDDKHDDSNGLANSQTIPNLNINSSNNGKNEPKLILHLPPISKTMEMKRPLNESPELERGFNLIKQILKPSIATNAVPLKRRQSLVSLKTINCDQEVNRSDLLSNNCDNNSICATSLTLRPLTAPVVSNAFIHDRINLTNNSTKLSAQVRAQLNLLPLINSGKTKRLHSGRRLPPIADNPKRKVNKIRCSFCRNKLTIINRFKCRSAYHRFVMSVAHLNIRTSY